MHEFVVVLVKQTENLEDEVHDALRPYQEQLDDSDNFTGWWDWFQIGGRWTGVFSDYDPNTDPKNIVTCQLCFGTGTRPDWEAFGEAWREANNGCNGCQGKGTHVSWPTQWGHHPTDIVPVSQLAQSEHVPVRLVTPDGVLSRDGFDAEVDPTWRDTYAATLTQFADMFGVVVDCHS